MVKKETFEFFLDRLIKGYRSYTGKEPEGLDLIKVKQEARQKFIEQNKVIEFPQRRSFKEEIDNMIKKGEINIGTADKTPPYTPSKSQTDFELQEKFRANNEKAIEAFKKRNPKDEMAKGGRAGYYGGGQAMVGEDMSDIGHGSDSLMARNMQLAPNSQATTSTGLNYLLGQDNDTVRVPYAGGGKGMDKRTFLKLLGSFGAGVAGIKSGILGIGGKKAATETAKEVVQQTAAGGPPPYFFKLVEKIKFLGDDAPKLAVKNREKVTTYKDYTLTEDVTTGEQTIQRMKIDDDLKYDASEYYGKPVGEEVYMSYRPGKGQMDETTKGKTPPDEYTEDTSLIRSDRPAEGEVMDTFDGVPDDVLKEVEAGSGNVPESFYTGPNPIKKADGGRIGYAGGKKVIQEIIKAGEGKFTKAQYLIERIKNTIKGSPDDKYVQETFPGFIKELEANPDLAKNENVFKELGGDLPEGQQIVVYGDDTLDFFTTSSGPQNIQKLENFMAKNDLSRDKALEIMKMEPNDQVMELKKTKFLKQKRTDNAEGGRIGLLSGGGPLKTLINNLAKERGLRSGSELLEIMNYKNLPSKVKNLMTKEEFDTMKANRLEGVERWKDLMISQQEMTKNVDAGMNTPAAGLFKELEKTSPGYGIVPRNIRDQDILQMEQMIKNMETKGKGRKANATGGLATMLGE